MTFAVVVVVRVVGDLGWPPPEYENAFRAGTVTRGFGRATATRIPRPVSLRQVMPLRSGPEPVQDLVDLLPVTRHWLTGRNGSSRSPRYPSDTPDQRPRPEQRPDEQALACLL
jgi:hypothetical protein